MRIPKICIIFKVVFALGNNIVATPKLKSSRNTNLNWIKYNYIIVGNQNSKHEGYEWGNAILKTKKFHTNKICVIASVSKYMTLAPGSKYLIRNSIKMYENTVPIYIDWNEKFALKNKINEYPTILAVTYKDGNLIEIGRITGKYTLRKMLHLQQLF